MDITKVLTRLKNVGSVLYLQESIGWWRIGLENELGREKNGLGSLYFFPKILGQGNFFFLFKTHRKNVTIFSM
jgi:hypothetical protein